MTRLTIIPNVDKKRLTFDGKIASGEHVELRVYDFADKIEEGRLRVRAVDFQGNTLAVFPVKARDENGDVEKDENGNDVWEQWGVDEDYEYATCVFNLNTIPALKYFRRGGECLIVLDDPESKTLYGSGHLCVLPWPKEIGKDEPVDLDSYPDNIKDFVRRLDDAEDNVEVCRRDVESALSFASNANTNANTAVTTAQNAMSASSEAKTSAANALTDSAAAKKAAQDAEGLVAAAQNAAQAAQDAVGNLADVARSGSYNDLSDKPQIPSIKGLAKKTDVDHVENVLRGELNGEISRSKAAEMALKASVEAKAESTALTSERQRAEAAENDLRARIAALKSFDKRVVNALPATGLANTMYLVPSANSSDRNVKDEYLWINGAWEQIGSTSVDLTDYAKKSELPRRPEDIGAQNALNPSQLAAVNSGITADKVAKMALKEDVPTKTSDLENDSNFAADVLERTCVHEFPGGSVQACSGARVSATEWRFTDYENVVGIGQHYLLFSDGVWDFGKFNASGDRMSMETVSAPFDAESLDFGAFGNVVFSGVDDMVARSGQIPKAYVKDAEKSSDGKTLTLTKADGTVVSFQGGGGSYTPSEITDGTNTIKADRTVLVNGDFWEYSGSWTEGQTLIATGSFPRWVGPDGNVISYDESGWHFSVTLETINIKEGIGENATRLSFYEGYAVRRTGTVDKGKLALDEDVDSKVETAKTKLNARIDPIEATSRQTVKFDPTATPRLDTAEKIVAHIVAQFDNGETEAF